MENASNPELYLVMPRGRHHGWGICGRHLALEMSRMGPMRFVSEPFSAEDDGDRAALEPFFESMADLQGLARGAERLFVDAPVIQAIQGNNLLPWGPRIDSPRRIGYTFFEDNVLPRQSIEDARRHFDVVVAGSSWCELALREAGLENTQTIIQGVDPSVFHPGVNGKRRFGDAFVIFSGGKLEFRKGQDLVIRAFRHLRQKYGDVLLVASWYNAWPASLRTLAASPYIRFPSSGGDFVSFARELLRLNGVDPEGAILLPAMENARMAQVYGDTDVGLFPNRCEGGTNLVLMEYMACGKPAIASLSSGHRDILTEANSLPVRSMRKMNIEKEGRLIAVWDDPDLDEIVAKLEWAYTHREALRPLAGRAGQDLVLLTWRRSARQFRDLAVGNGRAAGAPVLPAGGPGAGKARREAAVLPLLGEALEHHRAGRLPEAEPLYLRILEADPLHAESLHLLGCIRLQQDRTDEAIPLIRRAVDAAPRIPLYHARLAEACYRSGRTAQAEEQARLALRLDAGQNDALDLLGRIALERCDYGRAIGFFADATKSDKPRVDSMVNMTVALNRTGHFDMARSWCDLVLKLEPENPAAWINLGMAFRGMGRYAEAKAAFEKAGPSPQARFNLGFVCMLEGDLARGLPLLEYRKEVLPVGRGLDPPEWDGSPQPGKHLLVVHEQGLGDTILMSRFFPRVLPRVGKVTALVQKPLARLLASSLPGVETATSPEGLSYDLWCPAMSLPLLLGIDRADAIPAEPWLRAPAARPPGDRFRAGINWAGNPGYAYDFIRSTRLEELRPLLDLEGIEWVSLHKGHLEAEADAFGLAQPLRKAADFFDTAAVIAGLDLVVSTETVVPNLSAALGVPTCLLTCPDPDWRWRSWYQGVTLCRQQQIGDWKSAVSLAAGFVSGLREKGRSGRTR